MWRMAKAPATETAKYLVANTARVVAITAHAGAYDKLGEPYLNHVRRVVASQVRPDYRAVAWLHDVVEDTGVTLDDLRDIGFPDEVVEAVDAITHRPSEPRSDYYARVRANKIAWAVKLADVIDNVDPERLGRLDPATRVRLTAKYEKALRELASADHWLDTLI